MNEESKSDDPFFNGLASAFRKMNVGERADMFQSCFLTDLRAGRTSPSMTLQLVHNLVDRKLSVDHEGAEALGDQANVPFIVALSWWRRVTPETQQAVLNSARSTRTPFDDDADPALEAFRQAAGRSVESLATMPSSVREMVTGVPSADPVVEDESNVINIDFSDHRRRELHVLPSPELL